MRNLTKRIEEFVGKQQRHPTGLIGRVIGERMLRQHALETNWTISLLQIKPTDRVLEIGFGAGRGIELAAAQAAHVTGIDLSQPMVLSASRRNAQAIKAGRVELHCGDATTLPFADQQFDKLLSIHTLYFWPDPSHTLAEIFRVLKPDGIIALTLSTGKVDSTETTGLERYQDILEEQLIPDMKRLGFTIAYLIQGPTSRQFKVVALVGVK